MKLFKRIFKKRLKPMTYEEAEALNLHFLLEVDGMVLTYLTYGSRIFCNPSKEKYQLIKRTLEFHLEMVDAMLKEKRYR